MRGVSERSPRLCKASASLTLIALVGCVTPAIAPLTATGHQFGLSVEEQKLLAQAHQLHEELDRKGLLLDQPELRGYVAAVARRLVPGETAGVVDFRFHILRLPIVNAFAVANGEIYLTVGLLARLDSEAELAQVLGHEISHVVLRHGLKQYEIRRSGIVAAHIADLLLFGTSIAYLPFLASSASFSREQEVEADRVGLQSVVAAGYDAAAAVKIFVAMQEVKKGEEVEGSAYSTHPTNQKRAVVLRAMIDTQALIANGRGRSGENEYTAFRSQIMAENIQLDRWKVDHRIGPCLVTGRPAELNETEKADTYGSSPIVAGGPYFLPLRVTPYTVNRVK
jgi:predicted Zn-dependent protease